MEIISHRGNSRGPNPLFENTIEAIEGAMVQGFSVEFDVRWHNRKYWLGHDEPEEVFYEKDLENLLNKHAVNAYVHCKTVETLQRMVDTECGLNVWLGFIPFYHDMDEAIVLSNGKIWVHPRAWEQSTNQPRNSIIVQPTLIEAGPRQPNYHGYCTDYPIQLRESFKVR